MFLFDPSPSPWTARLWTTPPKATTKRPTGTSSSTFHVRMEKRKKCARRVHIAPYLPADGVITLGNNDEPPVVAVKCRVSTPKEYAQ